MVKHSLKKDEDDFIEMRNELYRELEKGIKSLDNGETYTSKEVYEELDRI